MNRQALLSPEDSFDLIHLGAVYCNKERTRSDRFVNYGDQIRIFKIPKRFPVNFSWRERILFENQDFLVLDKPAGLPVHATLDNAVENVAVQLGLAIGQKLFVTHRLDTVTSGLLVLAKSTNSQSYINKRFAKGLVTKSYLARLAVHINPGTYVHYMEAGFLAPRVVGPIEFPGMKRCELVVESILHSPPYWDATITLVTGRTHQIRTQMKALGAPLVGDTLYESTLDPRQLKLVCVKLEWDQWKFSAMKNFSSWQASPKLL